MAEYIERSEAIEFTKQNTPNINGETTMQCVERSLLNVPAADVVEVVRCKNCKHRDKSGLCQAEGQKLTIAKDNHFCSKGERRLDNGSN